MKLLESLKRQPADNCFILTYNLDPLFFEYALFPHLYGNGCRNTVVLCDPRQYQEALRDVTQLRFAGQRYLLLPGLTSSKGAFHAKLILMTGRESGRVWLTSGNLTKAGYTHNLETVTFFEYQAKKPDPIARQACRWAVDALRTVAEQADGHSLAIQRLEQLLGTTPWLTQEPADLRPEAVRLLHNLDSPLWEQMIRYYREHDDSPVTSAVVISPYFDRKGQVFQQLLSECRPTHLTLYTQEGDTGLDPSVFATHLERFSAATALSSTELYNLDLSGRRLHAKALLLKTEQGVWLLTGSANFSAPALLETARKGNTEFAVLRHENVPDYFDAWLAEITVDARPLDLGQLTWEEADDAPVAEKSTIDLVMATFETRVLTLQCATPLPADALVEVLLTREEEIRHLTAKRLPMPDLTSLRFEISPTVLSWLEKPTLIQLQIESDTLSGISNPVLLHNVDALQRYGRPIDRRPRPEIPPGMVPQSYEHCAQLMEMLHDLLATNREHLNRHRRRITSQSERDEQERQMAIDEDGEYDPESQFVPEPIRRAGGIVNGADLYADYYDRLTYEDVLRAVLAAVYTPAPGPQDGDPPPPVPPPPPPPIEDVDLRARTLARIESGIKRLIHNFQQGAAEPEYLAEVPPVYLTELFMITSSFLREVWRQEMLETRWLIEHSLNLFQSFWGGVGAVGAWPILRERLTNTDVEQLDSRLQFIAQTWLHCFIVAQLLEDAGDRRRYDLAAWIRYIESEVQGPGVLRGLDTNRYNRLWKYSTPASWEFRPAEEVIPLLRDLSQCYDEQSLLDELATWSGARAKTSIRKIAGQPKVPTLEVTLPLSKSDLNDCLKIFLTFLHWPTPKSTAWARFTNSNPPESFGDIKSTTLYYEVGKGIFTFAVENADGKYVEDFDRNVPRERLKELSSLAVLRDWQAKQITGPGL